MPIIVLMSAPLVAASLMRRMAKPVVCATLSDDDLYQTGTPIFIALLNWAANPSTRALSDLV
jgi:hypothetical protein